MPYSNYRGNDREGSFCSSHPTVQEPRQLLQDPLSSEKVPTPCPFSEMLSLRHCVAPPSRMLLLPHQLNTAAHVSSLATKAVSRICGTKVLWNDVHMQSEHLQAALASCDRCLTIIMSCHYDTTCLHFGKISFQALRTGQ